MSAQIVTLKDNENQNQLIPRTKTEAITDANNVGLDSLLDNKVDKITGKGLSTNDYTTAEKTKLSGIESGADVTDAENVAAAGAYFKPNGGIPKTDLASNVQTSLGKADSAIQSHQSLAAYRTSAAQDVIDNGKIHSTEKGVANGIATLDNNAKVPLAQINDALLGNVKYQTTWNASTNTPTLPATPTTKGQYWIVSVAGAQFGTSFEVGDWIIAGDGAWQKVDNTDAVSTVAGRTGNVVLTKSDVGLGNVDNTSDANKPISTATQTALDGKQATISDLATIRSGASAGATAVQPEVGKGLSTNDYTTAEKNKLAGIEAGADVTDSTNVETAGAVMTTTQTLTTEQKTQVRTNISAAASSDIPQILHLI